MNPISLKFMKEKREGYGEDSPPLSIFKDDSYAVGVFDGMGGSGAAICKSKFGDNHTKAYVASRIIQEAITTYIKNTTDVREINADGIASTARNRLKQEKNDYSTKVSGLRSKLVRDYPTTLAITTATKNENETHSVNSYWAGDSRNYLWTIDGFYQISKDDLDTELDPLENLRNDGALSNCICADSKFVINTKTINVPGKFVILSATDGCFNYFATPMQFQETLLNGLKQSKNEKDWEDFCREEFSAVTGDDVSISLLAIGFDSFEDLKETFVSSTIVGIQEIKNLQERIYQLESEIEQTKGDLKSLIQSEWDKYKVSYMKYFCEETKSNSEDCHHITPETKQNVSSSKNNGVVSPKEDTHKAVTTEVTEASENSDSQKTENSSVDSQRENDANVENKKVEEAIDNSDITSSEPSKDEKEVTVTATDKNETTTMATEAEINHHEDGSDDKEKDSTTAALKETSTHRSTDSTSNTQPTAAKNFRKIKKLFKGKNKSQKIRSYAKR